MLSCAELATIKFSAANDWLSELTGRHVVLREVRS